MAHFRVLVCLCVKTSLRAKLFLWKRVSPAHPFSCKSNSFSYEKFCMKTRFETEVKQNSEMGYCIILIFWSDTKVITDYYISRLIEVWIILVRYNKIRRVVTKYFLIQELLLGTVSGFQIIFTDRLLIWNCKGILSKFSKLLSNVQNIC